MDRLNYRNPAISGWRLFLKLGWMDIALLVLAAAFICLGYYLRTGTDWTPREDIRNLNKGVTAFNEPPGALPAADGRPIEYPIQRAAWYWGQAAANSTDIKIQSLAYYNLGTLSGRESWAQALPGEGHARTDMAEGIKQLGHALRIDPSNEDAKFNLELMEKAAQVEGQKQGAPGPGYSPGAVEKGY
ncbi:MAG TPA: hypothetical protein VF932_15740 [Anaerolineae bacterium]